MVWFNYADIKYLYDSYIIKEDIEFYLGTLDFTQYA